MENIVVIFILHLNTLFPLEITHIYKYISQFSPEIMMVWFGCRWTCVTQHLAHCFFFSSV